jgi:hypothetical protein
MDIPSSIENAGMITATNTTNLVVGTKNLMTPNNVSLTSIGVIVVLTILASTTVALLSLKKNMSNTTVIQAYFMTFLVFCIINTILVYNNHYTKLNNGFIDSMIQSLYVTSGVQTYGSSGNINPNTTTAKISHIVHEWYVFMLTGSFIAFSTMNELI